MTSEAADQRAEQAEMPFGRLVLFTLPVVMLVAAAFWYALSLLQPPPQKEIVFSTGSASGGYHAFGMRYQAAQAR